MKIADNGIAIESKNPFLKNFKRKRIMYIDIYDEKTKEYVGDSVFRQSTLPPMHRHSYFTGMTDGKFVFIVRFVTVRESDAWKLDAVLGGIFHEAEKLGIKTYESSCEKIIRKMEGTSPQTEEEFRKQFPL